VQDGAVEVDLVPAQVAGLGGAQPVPEGHQDHGRIPVTVSVGLGGLDQSLDLAGRQVLPGPKLCVRTLTGATVRFTSVGVASLRCDFAMENSPPQIETVRSFRKLRTIDKPESRGESNYRAGAPAKAAEARVSR
jgi:hypothetical protein